MAKSNASTVDEYLASLPDDRRADVVAVRNVILANLPDGYAEEMPFGMPAYVVPLSDYPKTYNRQPLMYAALAAQKNYTSLYLMNVYGNPDTEERFHAEYAASGKKLDMGKSCVRFKHAEDLPLDVIGRTIASTTPAQYIASYEAALAQRKSRR